MAQAFHSYGLLLAAVSMLVAASLIGASTPDIPRSVSDRVTSLPDYGPFKSPNYAGYVDIGGGRKSFYYFIESERNPSTDPLLLWLNGGPGCSSLIGLFTEVGPYTLRHGGKFYNNSYGYTTVANVLFLESPSGVGFSKDTQPATPSWDDNLTATINYQFLLKWLHLWPQYRNRSFYISGESYAGHYIPQLASAILHGSDAGLRSMMRGIMVGNPCTGSATNDYEDWCFTVLDPTLEEWYKSHAFISYDPTQNVPPPGVTCDYPTQNCSIDPILWAQFDPYNTLERYCALGAGLKMARWMKQSGDHRFRQEFKGGALPTYGACADYYLGIYMNRPDVQRAIHADVGTNWQECSDIINYPTPATLPGVKPVYYDLMQNTNWSILIYSGTADTVVNFIQTEKVVISMNRPVVTPYTPWYYQDMFNYSWKQLGGFYVQYDRISWASVGGAGHMVPQYVPQSAIQLLNSFIATGKPGMSPPSGAGVAPDPALLAAPAPQSSSVAVSVILCLVGFGAGILVGAVVVFFCCRRASRSTKELQEQFIASRDEN
jgi:serine carboxypeptidase-like clade 2